MMKIEFSSLHCSTVKLTDRNWQTHLLPVSLSDKVTQNWSIGVAEPTRIMKSRETWTFNYVICRIPRGILHIHSARSSNRNLKFRTANRNQHCLRWNSHSPYSYSQNRHGFQVTDMLVIEWKFCHSLEKPIFRVKLQKRCIKTASR